MTPFIKKNEIKKNWYIINAENASVGRLAAFISGILRGKNKSTFNPHIDNGDFESDLEAAMAEYGDLYEEDMYDPVQYTYIYEDAYLLSLS